MEIKVIEKKVPSVDGIHNLAGKVYCPNCNAKGIFHLVHGMTEHINRYDSVFRDIAEDGYIVCAYNHLGHGYTVNDDSELGYIAHENGWKLLVDDVANFAAQIRSEYGENLPYILMGHSMGSFVVRNAVLANSRPDKLIIMGTGGPNPVAGIGLLLIKLRKKIKGDRYFSKFIDNLAFSSYNKKFGDDDKYNWLTKNEDVRKAYSADKYCTFKFSLSAMQDLVTLQINANNKKWFTEINPELPILLLSGNDDPVGEYGKGVRVVYDRLLSNNKKAEMHLFDNCRHEILNDTCRDEVVELIKKFINS